MDPLVVKLPAVGKAEPELAKRAQEILNLDVLGLNVSLEILAVLGAVAALGVAASKAPAGKGQNVPLNFI